MASPSRTKRALAPVNPMAGWDIVVAAIALAAMTTGFWRLWPDALALNDAPLGPVILKAGIAALGFVGIASRWEQSWSATLRNPFGLVLVALACASTLWSIAPSEALRHGILLLVLWGFGISLALRFKSLELAEICGFAGVVGVVMQVTAHKGVPPVDHFDGDLAFALIGSAWAALRVPARRMTWIIATGLCFAFAFAAVERATLGAILGFVFGLGLAAFGTMLAKRGTVSVLVTAWAIVAAIVALTMFAMFGAAPLTEAISRYFSDLGSSMIIGQGFGVIGQSVGAGIGAGLGILGTCLVILLVFATLFQTLFGNPTGPKALMGQAGVCFACVGAMITSPQEVTLFGPITILFAATSFAISLACVPKPRPRKALLAGKRAPLFPRAIAAGAARTVKKPRRAAALTTQPIAPGGDVSTLGLRPRQ
jgi:hypothetical protein